MARRTTGGTWRRDADKQPDPPKQGIPPQPTPRWVARCFQLTVFPFMIMDLAIQSLIQRISPPPYRLEGSCQKRGNCCHYIFLEWPPVLDKYPWLGRFWLWWFTDVHGFYLRDFSVENEDNRVARVMSCRHLQPDGSCGNYALRPAICRQWPRVLFTRKPYILKGCGYKAVPRDDEPPSEPPPS